MQEPYNIQTDAPVFAGSYIEYLNFIDTTYFDIIQQRSILEIGPFQGDHSKLIVDHDPLQFEIVEGNKHACSLLETIPGVTNIIHDDVMQYLTCPKPVDVVVCFGVLYHLHSPLHLLELIVNYCNPEYILLDCVMESKEIAFFAEAANLPGNNQIRNGWKSCSVNLVIPFLMYLDVMKTLGYQLDLVNRLQIHDQFSKHNSWVARWKKV